MSIFFRDVNWSVCGRNDISGICFKTVQQKEGDRGRKDEVNLPNSGNCWIQVIGTQRFYNCVYA